MRVGVGVGDGTSTQHLCQIQALFPRQCRTKQIDWTVVGLPGIRGSVHSCPVVALWQPQT